MKYNISILRADAIYSKRAHSLFCDNCHNHVAMVLNKIKYDGRSDWTMVSVWWMCIAKGKYVSTGHIVRTYICFVLWICLFLSLIIIKAVKNQDE